MLWKLSQEKSKNKLCCLKNYHWNNKILQMMYTKLGCCNSDTVMAFLSKKANWWPTFGKSSCFSSKTLGSPFCNHTFLSKETNYKTSMCNISKAQLVLFFNYFKIQTGLLGMSLPGAGGSTAEIMFLMQIHFILSRGFQVHSLNADPAGSHTFQPDKAGQAIFSLSKAWLLLCLNPSVTRN